MSDNHIRLHLEHNPGGVYTVTSPDVPGLVTEDSTPEEILHNTQEALEALFTVGQVYPVFTLIGLEKAAAQLQQFMQQQERIID
ncbi:MAG TPA: hypothetical protein EYH05_04190, partial [Anaerolineae bacterium]|nr:hypothetical protein [Anaerolineae bacterium]